MQVYHGVILDIACFVPVQRILGGAQTPELTDFRPIGMGLCALLLEGLLVQR